MSAFVRLDKQDAFVVPYTAHKSWIVDSASLQDYGIEIFIAKATGSYTGIFNPTLSDTTGQSNSEYSTLVYRSLKHLYYSGVYTGAESSSSFEDYKQTTLSSSMSRTASDNMLVFSMPRETIGSAIKPSSLIIASISGEDFLITDNGEGSLLESGVKVGDIIYSHGQAVINDHTTLSAITGSNYYLQWQSTHELYTSNYRCRVREQELNYSQNPSIKSGSNGEVYNFATGSYFQPYVTTVGLYNDANELVAVGKLAQPVPKSRYIDMTFVVKFDV